MVTTDIENSVEKNKDKKIDYPLLDTEEGMRRVIFELLKTVDDLNNRLLKLEK